MSALPPPTPSADPVTPLPGLPGSAADPGSGPVPAALLDGLLDDAGLLLVPPQAPQAVDQVLAEHRALRDLPARDVLAGPLLVPVGLAEAVAAALQPTDHALRVLLVPDPPDPPDRPGSPGSPGSPGADQVGEQLQALRRARNLFLDDDRVEVAGVQVTLPGDLPAGAAARAVVHALDFTAPTWLTLGPGIDDPEAAMAVLAEDGAEGVALPAGGPLPLTPAALAAGLRAAVDRELTVRAVGGPLPWVTSGATIGVLNLLCAVRAALNGAETGQLTTILAATRSQPLLSALRRMSDPDAAVARAFLAAAPVAPVAAAAADLDRFGLLPPDLH